MSTITISPFLNSSFLKGISYIPGIGHTVNAIVTKKLDKLQSEINNNLTRFTVNSDEDLRNRVNLLTINNIKMEYEIIAKKCKLITKACAIVLLAIAIFATPITLGFVLGGYRIGWMILGIETFLISLGLKMISNR
ncbi:hypothetical protein BN1013_02111 [Candidatus Rubidus massiliensis]|nr:hypothetical protein BN1013_02111 [Candidatus Rubidus massiliensis]